MSGVCAQSFLGNAKYNLYKHNSHVCHWSFGHKRHSLGLGVKDMGKRDIGATFEYNISLDEWHIAQLSNLLGFGIERDNDGRAKDADVEFALQTLIENLQLG